MRDTIPRSVLDEFGCKTEPILLPGGQNATYRAGNVVVKPCPNAAETEGLSEAINTLIENGFRVARPIRGASGHWVVADWQACRFVHGQPGIAGREDEAIHACRALHGALRTAYPSDECPPWLGQQQDSWYICDRVAWGKQDPGAVMIADAKSALQPLCEQLCDITDIEPQIIHGDPSGDNILFHDVDPPAMIDITPYWHPSGYATAMLLSDAVAWEGSHPSVLNLGECEPHYGQLLLRAVLFRLCVPALWGDIAGIEKRAAAHTPVLDFVGIER